LEIAIPAIPINPGQSLNNKSAEDFANLWDMVAICKI
jgi:hypothetical protein